MQLFNQINARELSNGLNIFRGLFSNYLALILYGLELFLQVILTEFGRAAFSLSPKVRNRTMSRV
jgi:hypothetical protein